MRTLAVLALSAAALLGAAAARSQDIRGMEVCTAEKDTERRTGCLQANVELLQQLLTKEIRRAQAAEVAAAKDNAALKADVAALKSALEKTQSELAELKKPKPAEKEKKQP